MKKSSLEVVSFPLDYPQMKPRAHQEEAIERYKDKDEIALFFEMGCGKSFTLLKIAEAKYKAGEIEGLLVIAPNDVHRQWHDELVNGAGEAHEMELSVPFMSQCFGGRGGSDTFYDFLPGYFWFLSVNVDTFSTASKWRPITEWANSHKIMIAVDEATTIKNPKAKRTERILYEFNRVKKSRGRIISSEKINPWRAVLTGTPVTNGPCDMWAIMEFLKPNYFNMNWWAFRDYYAMFTQIQARGERSVTVLLTEDAWKGIKRCPSYDAARYRFGCSEDTYFTIMHQPRFEGPYKHADKLRQAVEPVASFKLLEECEDMPERNYVTRHVGMSAEQRRLYSQALKELAVEFKGAVMTAQNILVLYLRLQQISSGFIVNSLPSGLGADDDLMPGDVVWIGSSCPKLDAIVQDLDEVRLPALVLTRYTAEAERLYNLCCEKGLRTGLFTGWKVIGGVDAMKDGELDVLVANSQKIARGFNLQCSHVTLFYSNTFSMETRQQAEFRTFRIGQKEKCLYIDYIASPVEEKIVESLKMKKSLLDYVRGKKLDDHFCELAKMS